MTIHFHGTVTATVSVVVDSSPYAEEAHERVLQAKLDSFSSGEVMLPDLVDLPPLVIYDLVCYSWERNVGESP